METTNFIKIVDYAELIAKIKQLEVVFYEESGDYQGDYLAVLADDHNFYFYLGSYGSCSGCDWLEGEQQWIEGEGNVVDYKVAANFVNNELILTAKIPIKPFLDLPNANKLQFLNAIVGQEVGEWKDEDIGILVTKFMEGDFTKYLKE